MSQPGTLAAALAFVPNWWQETADPFALDSRLTEWSRACGWRACGLVLPGEGGTAPSPGPCMAVRSPRAAGGSPRCPAAHPVRRKLLCCTLRPGAPDACSPASSPPGGRSGCCGPNGPPAQPWGDAEREYLVLSARAVERSPAVAVLVGPVIDPERLSQRLADAAVIAGPDGPRLRQHPDWDHRVLGPGAADASARIAGGRIRRRDREGGPARHPVHAAVAPTEPQRTDETESAARRPQRSRRKNAAQTADEPEPAGREGRAGFPGGRWRSRAGRSRVVLGHLLENAVGGVPAGRRRPHRGPADRISGSRSQDLSRQARWRRPPPGDDFGYRDRV